MASDKDQKRKTNKVRNDERKNGKAFKKAGSSRCRGVEIGEVAKVLLGGGRLVHARPDNYHTLDAWRGAEGSPAPFDKAQAEENKRLYPHLFTGR